MNPIIEWLLSNSIVAVVLCLLGALAMRVSKTPALGHTLWVLALVKMITPPLFYLPVNVDLGFSVPESIPLTESVTQDLAMGRNASIHREQISAFPKLDPFMLLLGLWGAGTVAWFFLSAQRLIRFRQLLKQSDRATGNLNALSEETAKGMGLQAAPELYLVKGVVPPMLWGFFGKSLILFPEELIRSLSRGESATLLAHEMAHYRRRDHWYRWIEILVTGTFWWNPVVWWARNGLRQAEEECCDAWVVRTIPFSAKQYARAIVKTFDFLAGESTPIPANACGVGDPNNTKHIRKRFKMILKLDPSHKMSWKHVLIIGFTAAALLPLSGIAYNSESREDNDRQELPRELIMDDYDAESEASLHERVRRLERLTSELLAALRDDEATRDRRTEGRERTNRQHEERTEDEIRIGFSHPRELTIRQREERAEREIQNLRRQQDIRNEQRQLRIRQAQKELQRAEEQLKHIQKQFEDGFVGEEKLAGAKDSVDDARIEMKYMELELELEREQFKRQIQERIRALEDESL